MNQTWQKIWASQDAGYIVSAYAAAAGILLFLTMLSWLKLRTQRRKLARFEALHGDETQA